jgi:hypothetical protein
MNYPETEVKSTLDNFEQVSVRAAIRCAELESTLVAGAERELLAFVSAVSELFGPEHSRISFESWMQELESTDWPAQQEIPDWRQVSVRAAARIAASTGSTIQKTTEATSHEDPTQPRNNLTTHYPRRQFL